MILGIPSHIFWTCAGAIAFGLLTCVHQTLVTRALRRAKIEQKHRDVLDALDSPISEYR